MPSLPLATAFTDSATTEAGFKSAITDQREFLAGLLGTSGNVSDALDTLGVLGSSTLSKSSAYTVVAADRGSVIECTGTFTISLTAASTLGNGFIFTVHNIGTGTITIDPNSTELIDGNSSINIFPSQILSIRCNGTAFYSLTSLSKIQTQLITDSTDILLNNYATPSYSNVGSSFSINIPANGVIRISSFAGRLLNNATASQHSVVFGIRIGTKNYWFDYFNDNGTASVNTFINGGTTANAYREYFGTPSNPSYAIDVAAYAVPTGSQTVQLIAAYYTTQCTLKGTTKQTRVVLEFIG